MSKMFGFWPHITHVIVLTFKEIKHLSDYRTVGLSDRRTIGLSNYRSDPVLNRCWTILLLLFLLLNLLPEFDNSFRKELASGSYFSFMILYVSIISPLILLYAIVGNFSFFNLS